MVEVQYNLQQRLLAEALGTIFLVAAIIGSGIMATRQTVDPGLQLLANATATVGALMALTIIFGPISGAHFNPLVTLANRILGNFPAREILPYILVQVIGGVIGVVSANLMFAQSAIDLSEQTRSGSNIWLSEVIATLGLLLVVFLLTERSQSIPYAVSVWIGSAYWFTSSTSLANPAVTIARSLSNTFTGIAPGSVPMFIIMQTIGLVLAIPIIRFLSTKR